MLALLIYAYWAINESQEIFNFTISLIIGFAFTPYLVVALAYLSLYVLSPLILGELHRASLREHPNPPPHQYKKNAGNNSRFWNL